MRRSNALSQPGPSPEFQSLMRRLERSDRRPVRPGVLLDRVSYADRSFGVQVSWACTARPWQPYLVLSFRHFVLQVGWCRRVSAMPRLREAET